MRSVSFELLSTSQSPTDPMKVQQKKAEVDSERYQILKDKLQKLDQPIMQMAGQISAIQDRFNSKFYPIPVPPALMLISIQEKSAKKCSCGCPKLTTEAIIMIFQKTSYPLLVNGS
jgi:hypothetical protein